MGKLKIVLLGVLFFGCSSKNLDYSQIYIKHGEYRLYEILSKNLKENVIKSNKGYQLISFVDIKSPLKDWYIFINDKKERKIIKAPFPITCDNNSLNWETSFHCLVNKNNFNSYLRNFGISTHKSIKSNFLDILYDQKKYNAIKKREDIIRIMDSIPKRSREGDFDHEFVISNEKKLDSIFETINKSENAYWFPHLGLFKFKFGFGNNELMYVESDFLGYLGNEYKPW